jgi:hypothetical protein
MHRTIVAKPTGKLICRETENVMELVNYTVGIETEQHFGFWRFRIGGVKPMHFNLLHFSSAFYLERKWATLPEQSGGFEAHSHPTSLLRYRLHTEIIRYIYHEETRELSGYITGHGLEGWSSIPLRGKCFLTPKRPGRLWPVKHFI